MTLAAARNEEPPVFLAQSTVCTVSFPSCYIKSCEVGNWRTAIRCCVLGCPDDLHLFPVVWKLLRTVQTDYIRATRQTGTKIIVYGFGCHWKGVVSVATPEEYVEQDGK